MDGRCRSPSPGSRVCEKPRPNSGRTCASLAGGLAFIGRSSTNVARWDQGPLAGILEWGSSGEARDAHFGHLAQLDLV